MAEKDTKLDVSVLERQWLLLALQNQRNVLLRARNKEMAGSEIWQLRGRELDQIGSLIVKVQA